MSFSTECVALTTDIWTSVATEAFLRVTCHFCGEGSEMKSLPLTTMPLEERHSCQYCRLAGGDHCQITYSILIGEGSCP